MRVAQVTNLQESIPPLNKNGLEQVVHCLTEEFVKMGHEVTLFGTADSKTSAKLVPVWPTAVSRDPYGHLQTTQTYGIWALSKAFLSHEQFDIIHDHTRFTAAHFAGLMKTPVVSTLHHPVSFEQKYLELYPPEYQKYFKQNWEEHSQKVHAVVVSKFQQKELKTPSTVIPNGISLDEWRQFNQNPEDYLAFLGYITPNKGAAQAIQAVLPTTEKLIIAGTLDENNSEDKEYFEKEIKPLLSDRIQYLGPLDHKQKQDFLLKAKATLMPIQWDEPFGLVAIESLACGTPVIAWNRAAMPEIITDGVDGFLINSVAEMTEKIKKINQLDRFACRQKFTENFTSEIMAQKYVKFYEETLNYRQ